MTLNARIKAYKRGFGVFFGDYWAFIGKNAKIYTKECFAQNEAPYLQIIVELLQKDIALITKKSIFIKKNALFIEIPLLGYVC